jgi:hypothetical protein
MFSNILSCCPPVPRPNTPPVPPLNEPCKFGLLNEALPIVGSEEVYTDLKFPLLSK